MTINSFFYLVFGLIFKIWLAFVILFANAQRFSGFSTGEVKKKLYLTKFTVASAMN